MGGMKVESKTPGATARARTLPLQKLVNPVVRGVLRAPLLSRLAGKRLITLYVTGRKTGRRFNVPVAYTDRATTCW
jgi:hypothetical protein